MTLSDLLLRAGACWLLAYSFTMLDGPGGVFAWIREHIWHGRKRWLQYHVWNEGEPKATAPPDVKYENNDLLDCIVCTATWIGVIVMLAPDGVLLQGFGVAGIAMFIHSYTGWKYSG